MNTTKYPLSLLFLLMTLGPAMLLLWAVDRETPRVLRPALVMGKVPLFYYVLHFLLIHLFAVLPVVYGAWALVVVAMYPLCRWFAALKQRRSDAWLSSL